MIDVRGRGLMVGVEFGGTDSSNRLKAEKGVAMVGDRRHQHLSAPVPPVIYMTQSLRKLLPQKEVGFAAS